MQVHIDYEHSARNCRITPTRGKVVASLSRRNFRSAAIGITNMQNTKSYIVTEVAKNIKTEMKNVCS